MFKAINGLYNESRSCTNMNDMYTTFFNVDSGVKQDNPLSPLLFSLFINDFV